MDFTLMSMEELYRKDAPSLKRGKLYNSIGILTFSTAESHSEALKYDDRKICWPYYTQVEILAGIGGGIRLGFNIGELVDFLLGWTTIDIYGDDIEEQATVEKGKAELLTIKYSTDPFRTFEIVGTPVKGVKLEQLTEVLTEFKNNHPKVNFAFWAEVKSTPETTRKIQAAIDKAGIKLKHYLVPVSYVPPDAKSGPYGAGVVDILE